jgi:hypothetical protein
LKKKLQKAHHQKEKKKDLVSKTKRNLKEEKIDLKNLLLKSTTKSEDNIKIF